MTAPARRGDDEDIPDNLRDTVAGWLTQLDIGGDLDRTPGRRCRVCRDPTVMSLVNKLLARGFTNIDIRDVLTAYNRKLRAEGIGEINKSSIDNHKARHFDAQAPAAAVLRRVLEREAIETGMDLENAVGTILTPVAYMRTVMVRGFENLINENQPVSYADGASAAKALYAIEKANEGQLERAQLMAEMGRIITVVRDFVPKDQWPALQAKLRGEELPPGSPGPVQQVQTVRIVDIDDTPDETDER